MTLLSAHLAKVMQESPQLFNQWNWVLYMKSDCCGTHLFQHTVHHERYTGAFLRYAVHQVVVVSHVHFWLEVQLVGVDGGDAGGCLLGWGGGGSRHGWLILCNIMHIQRFCNKALLNFACSFQVCQNLPQSCGPNWCFPLTVTNYMTVWSLYFGKNCILYIQVCHKQVRWIVYVLPNHT